MAADGQLLIAILFVVSAIATLILISQLQLSIASMDSNYSARMFISSFHHRYCYCCCYQAKLMVWSPQKKGPFCGQTQRHTISFGLRLLSFVWMVAIDSNSSGIVSMAIARIGSTSNRKGLAVAGGSSRNLRHSIEWHRLAISNLDSTSLTATSV